MFLCITFIVLLAEAAWGIKIGYPPSIDQINFGASTFIALWIIRIFSFSLLLASSYFFSVFLKKESKKIYWLLLSITPLGTLVWLSYPIDAIKIFCISLTLFLIYKKTKKIHVAIIIASLVAIVISLAVFKERPGILEDLSVTKSQEQIAFRINVEDNTKPNIHLPLLVRRVSYNKYFFMLKNTLEETLIFFDLETIFFQEVHPLGQKAFVVFFWPEFFILLFSIYYLTKKSLRDKSDNIRGIFFISILSLVYFIFSQASSERRQIVTAFFMVLIFSEGLSKMLATKTKIIKKIAVILMVLTIYGWATNIFDRFTRPDYWLDNRPLAYDYILKTIKKQGLTRYSKIVVSDTLFAIEKYCPLYLSDCSKFVITNFDLYGLRPEADTLYVGYTGNFLGITSSGAKKEEIVQTLESKKIEIFGMTHILNNIASGYGQDLIIGGVRK